MHGPLRPQRPGSPTAIYQWAFCSPARLSRAPAPTTTSCAPAGKSHNAALRQLGNRLVGILHGCLKTGTCYDEHTAWGHRYGTARASRRLILPPNPAAAPALLSLTPHDGGMSCARANEQCCRRRLPWIKSASRSSN